MKKSALLVILMLNYFASNAQESFKITSVTFQVNNSFLFTPNQSSIKNYFSIGSKASVFIDEKFYVGISQLTSLMPLNLSRNNEETSNKIRYNDVAINAGVKFTPINNFYFLTGLRTGAGLITTGTTRKDKSNAGHSSSTKITTYLLEPELIVGSQLTEYLALEAGTSFRKNFGTNGNQGLSPSEFDGLTFMLSLVGKLPLNQKRNSR